MQKVEDISKAKTNSVIFDFDYTLFDSSSGIIISANYSLNELGFPNASDDAIRKTIGLSLPESFRVLTGNQDDDLANEYFRLFMKRADEIMVAHTVILDHAGDAIEHLTKRNIRMGIVSTKFRYRIEAMLDNEGIRDAFEVIIGGEDVSTFKPDPEGIFKAMESMNTGVSQTLYIGDSLTDAKAAANAEVPFAAVLTGVTEANLFAPYNALAVMENLSELPNLIGV